MAAFAALILAVVALIVAVGQLTQQLLASICDQKMRPARARGPPKGGYLSMALASIALHHQISSNRLCSATIHPFNS